MRTRFVFLIAILLTAVAIVSGIALGQDDQGPAPAEPAETFEVSVSNEFTYQGLLKSSGGDHTGKCDFQFKLFSALTGGSQIGSTNQRSNVNVEDGRFTTSLDFGGSAFQGSNRWLQIAVRCPAGSGSYTTLSPRQRLTAAPYALYANNAGNATTANSATNADTADYANDSDKLDNKSSGYFASQAALNSHDHSVMMVRADSVDGIDTNTHIEVLMLTYDIPDKCSGASPIDQWNILVTANGSVTANQTTQAYSTMGISIDDPVDVILESKIETTVQGGSTSADFIQSFNTVYLLKNIDSGSHDFRLLARESGGQDSYNIFQPRLIVQLLGYTCANSFNETSNSR